MAGPQEWGAVPIEEPQGAGPQSWGAVPVDAAPAKVPDAFVERVARGNALTDAMKKAEQGEGMGEFLSRSSEYSVQPEEVEVARRLISHLGQWGAAQIQGMKQLVETPGKIIKGEDVGFDPTNTSEVLENWAAPVAMMAGLPGGVLRPAPLRPAGLGRFSRPSAGPEGLRDQVVGTLPKEEDFQIGAKVLDSPAAEENLRSLWEERGIHPAEAVHDARTDAFLRKVLREVDQEPADRSGLPAVRNSPVPEGTPRTELAKTGEAHIDDLLDSSVTNRNIDNPVIDATHDVPYSAGGSVPLKDPVVYIDRHFPREMTVDGVTFDPADPFTIHENLEQHVMEILIKGGMDPEAAYKVGHFEFAEKAEGAWYRAHGIDQAKAEAAYQPFIDQIDHENPTNPPPNLYLKPYPHSNVRAAGHGPVEDTPPTKAEIARAKAILAASEAGEPLRAVGAEVTGEVPNLTQQPPPKPGRLLAAAQGALNKLFDIGRDAQMLVAPMATGTKESMAIAKDFANAMRRNRWEWSRIDSDVTKRFNPEQRKRMWDAADEESVARQLGESTEHQGLITLAPEERAAVEALQARAQTAWLRAVDLGMVEGEGLPAYTPRMVINTAGAGAKEGPIPLNGIGLNLRTRTSQMLRRKHMTAEETEAAAKAKLGEEAVLARDIRALPLATGQLEDAIAGRTLINNVRDAGKRTGEETVAEGFRPTDSAHSWFTIDHPAFRTWRPKFEEVDGKTVPALDANGEMIFQQVPTYVRGDFEGPLRSVLTQRSGPLYGAVMSLKGKTMSMIMNSPMIHNAVEWGRALPAMPGKVATFKVYFEGNRAKNNPAVMQEAIDAGLVPIGKRFFNQDITSIMEAPDLAPGRSWTAKILGAVPDLFDEAAGAAVKRAIDKAGDFWHNTLLWDRIADLQMGLYTNFRDSLAAKGVDNQTAARAAAHWANRYAGALPQEAMSDAARKVSNVLMFSRSFTLGNLGVMKDMLTGLPKDVLAQIERDMGAVDPKAVGYAKALARRKAITVVLADVALMYVGNSILQSAISVMRGDRTMDQEMHGYADRMAAALQDRAEHPLKLIQVFDFLGHVSSTYENEPTKQDRIRVGYAADGTAIYARNPAGKIGEEFTGYLTGPLDMIRRKLGTIARPGWQILANDKGFGRKVYDPNADVPEKYLRNIGLIAGHLAASQFPEGQISAGADLVKGEGDKTLSALGTFGPVAGVTFSRGAPGGPAVGELYKAREMHNYAVDAQIPDIRKQILRGDEPGARNRMIELGIPKGLQDWYVKTTYNPALRLSPRALRDFNLYATPEQKQRLLNAR